MALLFLEKMIDTLRSSFILLRPSAQDRLPTPREWDLHYDFDEIEIKFEARARLMREITEGEEQLSKKSARLKREISDDEEQLFKKRWKIFKLESDCEVTADRILRRQSALKDPISWRQEEPPGCLEERPGSGSLLAQGALGLAGERRGLPPSEHRERRPLSSALRKALSTVL